MIRNFTPLVGFLLTLLLGATSVLGTEPQDTRSRPRTRTRSRPTTQGKPAPKHLDLGPFRLAPDPKWTMLPVSSAMRRAHLVLPAPEKGLGDGELIVYYFGSRGAGSAEANILRWKGMFARPAEMSEEDFARRKEMTSAGFKVTTLEVHGSYLGPSFQRNQKPQPGHMMLTAVIEGQGEQYYIRTLGPEKTLEAWKKTWFSMLEKIEKKGADAEKEKKKPTAGKDQGW